MHTYVFTAGSYSDYGISFIVLHPEKADITLLMAAYNTLLSEGKLTPRELGYKAYHATYQSRRRRAVSVPAQWMNGKVVAPGYVQYGDMEDFIGEEDFIATDPGSWEHDNTLGLEETDSPKLDDPSYLGRNSLQYWLVKFHGFLDSRYEEVSLD